MLLWAARVAALVAVGFACYLTLSPEPAGAGVLPDWVGHLGIFAGVGASFALLHRASAWPASRLRLVALATAFLGVTTEVGQSFTGRDPSVVDLAFDLAGGLGAILAADALLKRRISPRRS